MKPFKSTLGNYACGYFVGSSSLITSDAQSILKAVYDMNTFVSEEAILSRLISHSSGENSIIRRWLIFGGYMAVGELPPT